RCYLKKVLLNFTASGLFSLLFLSPCQTESQESGWQRLSVVADSLQLEKKFEEAAVYRKKAVTAAKNVPDSIRKMLQSGIFTSRVSTIIMKKKGIPFFEKAYPLLPFSRYS